MRGSDQTCQKSLNMMRVDNVHTHPAPKQTTDLLLNVVKEAEDASQLVSRDAGLDITF